MLEITEMMFKSSSSRSSARTRDGRSSESDVIKLPKEIFLPEPKLVRPYTRLKMHRADENSMDGFQKAGCHMQYYNRMMQARPICYAQSHPSAYPFFPLAQVVRNCANPRHKVLFVKDFLERIIQQHVSNLLNNGLRSNHALFTSKYVKMAKNTVCADLRKLVHSIFPNYLQDYYDKRQESDSDFHPRFNFGRMHEEATEYR